METRTGRVAALALVCTIVMAPRSQLEGQVASRANVMRTAPVFATDTSLQVALSRIAAGSSSWRAALDSVSKSGRMVLVVTPDEVIVVDDPGNRMTDAFDTTSLAEAAPVISTDGAVNVVLAVVNLPLLDRLHAQLGTTRAEYEADLERLLIHEIYSHAVPYLIAGNITGRCPDPVEGQKPLDACSIRRENRIRAELGLGMRRDYGVSGLVLGRRR
jgi:hypothetical protein